MGNSQSSNVQQPTRRPSIHSGKLYIPSLAEFAEKTSNTGTDSNSQLINESNSGASNHSRKFNSKDFDKSASELKEVLPDNLKAYNTSIETMYRFWYSTIEQMTEQQFKEAAVLFYMNIFKYIPKARSLFNKNIELQAKQFFGMFRWLITNLRQPDPERLMKRIRFLGGMHAKMNIKEEWYSLFLLSFHDTMIDTLQGKYTPRIRFCMEQLYTVVMNIMLNKDFESLSSAKISHFIKACGKLETCLADTEARRYLQMYMEQQFCVELILFYSDYRKFKNSVSGPQMQQIGRAMMTKYIDNGAECEINISWTTRDGLYAQLKVNDDVFTVDVFDAACKEIVDLIQQNIWFGFKRSIMKHAVDADINYDDEMMKKSSSALQLATPNYGPSENTVNTPSKSRSFKFPN